MVIHLHLKQHLVKDYLLSLWKIEGRLMFHKTSFLDYLILQCSTREDKKSSGRRGIQGKCTSA